MSDLLPETYARVFFTTARIIKPKDDGQEWLWVNPAPGRQFENPKDAEALAELANKNGTENGLDIANYPYFVVKISRTSIITRY